MSRDSNWGVAHRTTTDAFGGPEYAETIDPPTARRSFRSRLFEAICWLLALVLIGAAFSISQWWH